MLRTNIVSKVASNVVVMDERASLSLTEGAFVFGVALVFVVVAPELSILLAIVGGGYYIYTGGSKARSRQTANEQGSGTQQTTQQGTQTQVQQPETNKRHPRKRTQQDRAGDISDEQTSIQTARQNGDIAHTSGLPDLSEFIGYPSVVNGLENELSTNAPGSITRDSKTRVFMMGPSGVGKTTLIKCVAGELGYHLKTANVANLQEYNPFLIEEMLKSIPQQIPDGETILVIEGLEQLLSEENQDDARIDAYLDALGAGLSQQPNTVVVGLYDGDEVDERVPQGFDASFVLDKPDNETRKGLIRKLLRERGISLSKTEVGLLANWTHGMVSGGIEDLIRDGEDHAHKRGDSEVELYHIEAKFNERYNSSDVSAGLT
jgi:hypothetical protein